MRTMFWTYTLLIVLCLALYIAIGLMGQ